MLTCDICSAEVTIVASWRIIEDRQVIGEVYLCLDHAKSYLPMFDEDVYLQRKEVSDRIKKLHRSVERKIEDDIPWD